MLSLANVLVDHRLLTKVWMHKSGVGCSSKQFKNKTKQKTTERNKVLKLLNKQYNVNNNHKIMKILSKLIQ